MSSSLPDWMAWVAWWSVALWLTLLTVVVVWMWRDVRHLPLPPDTEPPLPLPPGSILPEALSHWAHDDDPDTAPPEWVKTIPTEPAPLNGKRGRY